MAIKKDHDNSKLKSKIKEYDLYYGYKDWYFAFILVVGTIIGVFTVYGTMPLKLGLASLFVLLIMFFAVFENLMPKINKKKY